MNEKGAVLLMTVIILGAISGVVTMALMVNGIDNTNVAGKYYNGAKAKTLSDGCAEDALLAIRNNTSTVGTYSKNIGGDQCSYTIIKSSGTTRTVNSQSTFNGNVRRVQITLSQVNPQVNVSKWEEVNSF